MWNTRATTTADQWMKGEILKKLGITRYRVSVNGWIRHVHANHLRKDETVETPTPILISMRPTEPQPPSILKSPPKVQARSPYPSRVRQPTKNFDPTFQGEHQYRQAKTSVKKVTFADDALRSLKKKRCWNRQRIPMIQSIDNESQSRIRPRRDADENYLRKSFSSRN